MSNELHWLARGVARSKLSRRDFLGRAAALGVSAAAANTLLGSALRAAEPIRGGTMRLGLQGGSASDTLDPALTVQQVTQVLNRLWGEPLVELTADGGLEGKVAESFDSSADAKTWTFKIRQGITFSDGKTVTPEDVQATLRRHSDEKSNSGALGIMRSIQDVRVDGGNVVVELASPDVDLPYLLTQYNLMMQPNGGYDAPAAAIGTGPYVIKETQAGVRYVAEKNPNYWGDIGYAETIELLVINDNTARVSALQSGSVDMIDRLPPRMAGFLTNMKNLEIHSVAGPGHYTFVAHCDTAPFDNNDLRMALKYAINREEMVEKILFGHGAVGNDTPINATYPFFTEFPQREFDPDKAKFHFQKSGYDGPILLRVSENAFPGAPDAAALYQQSCAAAGITMDIKREPDDGYWSEVWNNKPFCASYWSGRATQSQMFRTAFLSTADWNDTRFFNPQFDQLLIASSGETDAAKRKQMLADMGTLIRDEGGVVCPMFNNFVDATTTRLAGWEDSRGLALMNCYAPLKMWVVA